MGAPSLLPSPSSSPVIVSHLDGTLLKSPSFFPYYMLMALEAGSPLRCLLLLLLFPLTSLLSFFFSDTLSMQLQIFVSVAGLKLKDVLAVSKAVLPKFFIDDIDPSVCSEFLRGGPTAQRYAVTSHPRVFVDHFLKHHLGVHGVLATELQVTDGGFCTGFVAKSGVLDERKKLLAVKRCFSDVRPHVGLCIPGRRHSFLSYCQDVVEVVSGGGGGAIGKEELANPLIFHDGRLAMRPTPMASLAIMLWLPAGITLACMRILIGMCLPKELAFPLTSLLGVKLRVKGAPPVLAKVGRSGKADEAVEEEERKKEGVIFVCTHRTLADPLFLSMALRRKVRALAYSISKVSEIISPIPATRLTRNREEDARIIESLLEKEDIFMCPEGTTCREAFLLRFSPLFADMAELVVPVALDVRLSLFQGTSVRGTKALDAIFFCLNPRPFYHVTFLDPLPISKLRSDGLSPIHIANLTQKLLADTLSFQCTNFNRRDKYNMLAGHDGVF